MPETTNFANRATNAHKVTTNIFCMKIGNYPLILEVTTKGNKLKTTKEHKRTTNSVTTNYCEMSLQTDTK